MRGFNFFVTGCGRCPYRESDQDGDSYCSAEPDGGRLIEENSKEITPSCPKFDKTEKR
jgi:hypothetical protein